MYKLNILKLYYQIKYNIAPYFFKDLLVTRSVPNHCYNTRNPSSLYNMRPKHEFMKFSIKYILIQTINFTINIILSKVQTHSFSGFKQYIKNYQLSLYRLDCSKANCYIFWS